LFVQRSVSVGDVARRVLLAVDCFQEVLATPFFLQYLGRLAKKVVDRLHLETLQERASRPGVIQGRLEEMGITDLMQSLEMGQKSCRLTLRRGGEQCELYFAAGQCKHAVLGSLQR